MSDDQKNKQSKTDASDPGIIYVQMPNIVKDEKSRPYSAREAHRLLHGVEKLLRSKHFAVSAPPPHLTLKHIDVYTGLDYGLHIPAHHQAQSQFPKEYARVRDGDVITLASSELYVVPGLIGLTVAEAIRAARIAGNFVLYQDTGLLAAAKEHSSSKPQNPTEDYEELTVAVMAFIVRSQSAEAGAELPAGSAIGVYIDAGGPDGGHK